MTGYYNITLYIREIFKNKCVILNQREVDE